MACSAQQLLDANCQPQVSREPHAFPGRGTEPRPAGLADDVGRSVASSEKNRAFCVSACCLAKVGEEEKKKESYSHVRNSSVCQAWRRPNAPFLFRFKSHQIDLKIPGRATGDGCSISKSREWFSAAPAITQMSASASFRRAVGLIGGMLA